MITNGKKLSLHNSVQSHGINSDTRSLGDNDEQRALELEVDKQSNIINSIFTLRQLGEDEETTPSTVRQAHTLKDGGKGLEVAFCYTARSQNAYSHDPSVEEEDVGDDDGDGENPPGNLKGNLGLDLARPFVEGKKIDGSEGVSGVDGARDDGKNPKPHIRKRCETGVGPEVREILQRLVDASYCMPRVPTM